MNGRKIAALAAQALGMAALGALTALMALVLGGKALALGRLAAIWGVGAGAGTALSLRCARRGIPAILAWPLAPVCWTAGHWAAAGMAPPAGGAMWIALCCVIGASAGEVLERRRKKNGG